jgi:serine/threonine protein phosphatase PrpC
MASWPLGRVVEGRGCLYWSGLIPRNGRHEAAEREKDLAVTITAAAQTDIGCVRKSNQDTFGVDDASQLYVVCDGMGGAAGGEVASGEAVNAFLASFDAQNADALCVAASAANAAVLARAEAEPALRGMGSTLVAAHVDGNLLRLVNVGDSRAYLVRGGECRQLTEDHSYVQEQVRAGLMTQALAEASPLQSVITRAVGAEEALEPDCSAIEVRAGDVVLLTSDGLTRHVTDAEIAALVGGEQSLEERCAELVELAKVNGGSDNITCVLLQVS